MNNAKYVNFNRSLPIGEESSSFLNKIKSAASNVNTTTIIIISILLFVIIAGL